MRSRILATVIGITVIAVSVFFVAAAIAVRRSDLQTLARELEREGALAAADLPPGDPASAQLPDDQTHDYALYTPDGRRHAGHGPEMADQVVRRALTNRVASGRLGPVYVAAIPVEVTAGQPAFVLRVAESARQATDATRRKLAELSLAALGILGLAALAGWWLGLRLVRPLETLRRAAVRFGHGDLSAADLAPTGISELDEVGEALHSARLQIGELLERERRFSADVSHQLRTPVTGIRVAVEAELESPRPDSTAVLHEVLTATEDLEATVVSLLALARDTVPGRQPSPVAPLISAVRDRWQPRFAAGGRAIALAPIPEAPVIAAPAAVAQCLDVLLDNALRYGLGTVAITAVRTGEHLTVSVADEGQLRTPGDALFQRRRPQATGTGIGLHLGRSLARAEGGDLRLAGASPTRFELDLALDPPPADF